MLLFSVNCFIFPPHEIIPLPLYDPGTDECSPSLKRKSTSDCYSEGNSRQLGKRKRYESQTEDNLSLHSSRDELDDETDL